MYDEDGGHKPDHIESDPSRMVIRVEQGKGRKDRRTSSRLPGHSAIETTTIYLHLVPARYVQITSPLGPSVLQDYQ